MTEYFKSFKNQSEKFPQFADCKTVKDKIKLVQQAVSSSENFSNVGHLFLNKEPKPHNTEKSNQLRDRGNKFYKNKKYQDAIKSYTESMLEVTIDSNGKCKEIALALGNRWVKKRC